MPRVLFVTTKIGFGHERVSQILADAIKKSFPECQNKITTYFDFFSPKFQAMINKLYVYGLRWFPNVFGYIYLGQKRYKGTGVNFWSSFLGRKYASLIRIYSPDLIIITQGLACQWLGGLKKKGLISAPLVAVITDFIAHPFWIHSEIDQYIVASDEMKNDLISRGIPSSKIIASGIPVDSRFSEECDKKYIRRKNDLADDILTVLIMGGGWGLGRIDEVLLLIEKMEIPMQLLVVTGKNRILYRKLKNKKFRFPVHVYGKVDNINELMAVSDMIITKAGGVTISELLASGLPAIIWDVIPGQEEANTRYLVKNKAGIKARNIGEIADVLKKMVLSENARTNMQRQSKLLGRPNSTIEAVRYIKRLLDV